MPTPTHPSLRLISRVFQQSYLPDDIAYNIVDGIQERGAKSIQRVTRKRQTGRRNDLKLFNFYKKLGTLEKGLRTYNITDVNRFKNDLLEFMDDYQENYRNGTINTIIPNILKEFTTLKEILNEIPITPFRDDQKEDVRSYGKIVRNIMRMINRKFSSSTSILPPPRSEPASLPMGEGLKPKPKRKPKPKSKTKKARKARPKK